MNFINKIQNPVLVFGGLQFTKMFSNDTRPLNGKVAIVTASTDG